MLCLRHLFAFALFALAACSGKQPVGIVPSSGVTLLETLPQPTSWDAHQATRQS